MKTSRKITASSRVLMTVYSAPKYTASRKVFMNGKVLEFNNVVAYDIYEEQSGVDFAKQHEFGCTMQDEFNEYLVLHYTDGTKEIFKNSYVDMFIG